MMDNNDYSRRDFILKFAMLSSASFLLGINSGCGSSDTSNPPYAMPVYGPSPMYGVPVPVSVVGHMFFLDPQSKQVILHNYHGVPIHTTFTIDFTLDVTASASATVIFTATTGSAVANTQAWGDNRTLVVTPSADLLNDTAYTLRIDDVMDANGVIHSLENDANAMATFKTIVA